MHIGTAQWAYDEYVANAFIDEENKKSLEYKDLVKCKSTKTHGLPHLQMN